MFFYWSSNHYLVQQTTLNCIEINVWSQIHSSELYYKNDSIDKAILEQAIIRIGYEKNRVVGRQ